MAMWAKSTLAGAEDAIQALGRRLREGRRRAVLTQMGLEELSGVDQSLISRLELGKAPHASLERVIRLGQALGDNFPLGYCPHEHRCPYRLDWAPPPWEGHLPYQTQVQPDETGSSAVKAIDDADRGRRAEDGDATADADFAMDMRFSDLA